MRWEYKSHDDWKEDLETFLSENTIHTMEQWDIIASIQKQLRRLRETTETTSAKYLWHCRGTLNASFSKLYDTLEVKRD